MSSAMDLHAHQRSDRHRLPTDRKGRSHTFSIAGYQVNIRTGEYDDGTLGEIFLELDRSGSTLSGILDAFATVTSIALQRGTPLGELADKFVDSRFEPFGITSNAEIREATSILDYAFRWLRSRYA